MLFNFSLNRLATSASVLGLTFGIAFVAQPAQKASAQVTFSSYQKSCSNIKVKDGDLLSATCMKIDGSYNNTSIHIPGIENINGVLTFNNSYNSSSWIPKPGSRSPDEATKPCVK
jgi:hypothetical protein